MRKLIIATCAAALMSAVPFGTASAQTTGPSGQDTIKTNSPMDAQNKMKKKKMKKGMMKSGDNMGNGMKSGTTGTGGTSNAGTNTQGGAASMNNNK